MPWDPSQYLTFRSQRLRGALDLMARIDLVAPRRIVDLGCGPGNVTALLRDRWPSALITAVDSSPEMLAAASVVGGVRFELADLAQWRPREQYDLVFSSASLHWLDNHEELLPRLGAAVAADGGVLAIQMPRNFASASHRLAREVAGAGPWRSRLAGLIREAPVHSAADYYRLLVPLARRVAIWETEYLHTLDGDNPVADWTRGSLLVPLLAALEAAEATEFEAEYRRRIKLAYPSEPDGTTLFPFRRIFIIAGF